VTRIVAGVAGGRTLRVPRGRRTRPTADRVREALFSALGDLAGATVLDLYAGSGAIGLEALSRGAVRATMVEHDPPAVVAIRANIAALALPGAEVVPVAVERHLGTPPTAYDVVVADPPYADDIDELLRLLSTGWAGNVVVLERSTRDPAPAWPDPLVPWKHRGYGDTTLWYGRRS
jgi:16S rRNA (guanine966-N2)-methyltransferase